jgi:hypothetical protein
MPEGIPTNIEFTFSFPDIDQTIDINTPVIQQYPNYLSLSGDNIFFDSLNQKVSIFHLLHRVQPNIGLIITYVTDSQGRIFKINLNHIRGVNT